MRLLAKLFPRARELSKARLANAALTTQCADLKTRLDALWTNYNQSEAAKNGFRAELEKSKAKLREQNDADLMLVSARIILDTLKGKKPEQADIALQQRLALAQQQAMGMSNVGSGYGGGLSALGGIGGIFGGFQH